MARGVERRSIGVVVRFLHPGLLVDLLEQKRLPSLLFVADAIKAALFFASFFLISGTLAAVAAGLPSVIGIGRNLLGWTKGRPPLEPEHEFEGWSEFQVENRVSGPQWFMVMMSSVLFFFMVLGVLIVRVGSNPEKEWHFFELQCLPKPSDQGGVAGH